MSGLSPRAHGIVLVVDDDEALCELLATKLRQPGVEVEWSCSAHGALARIQDHPVDLVLTDLTMEGMDGLDLCRAIHERYHDVPVVVLTGHGSLEAAVGAIRAGAYDFLTKPVDIGLLTIAVSRALEQRQLTQEVKRLRAQAALSEPFDEILGTSEAMQDVFDLIGRVAESDASVLVWGESGTGKELAAKALHRRSLRRNGPMLAINCAAVPPTLIESELFGHARGAFTDAKTARDGLFVAADGGTLLLDEIGELPLELQPKLLRALQERSVRPVGGTAEIPFDVRLITATNRDLQTEVFEKRFREDLYYRINVVSIGMPPLRERGGDSLLLADAFVKRHADRMKKAVQGIAGPAAERLLDYSWPGNVRELDNCIERAVVLARNDQLTLEDLPERIREHHPRRSELPPGGGTELVTIDELERRHIQRVLQSVGGNKSRAAEILGLDRRTLYRKLERLEKSS